MSAERSVCRAATKNVTSAASPATQAIARRHHGSGVGFQSGVPTRGAGRGGTDSGSSGSGGSAPPTAAMRSSAVTAPGSVSRAMRDAAVV